ncbi:MAG: D-amino acid aminotransferase [Pseudomonadota bacterium]
MTRIVYVNGEFLPLSEAKVSIFDRGLLFADAVYEVAAVFDGKIIDFEGHIARFHRSIGELEIPAPLSNAEILSAFRALIAQNGIVDGLVYMQVSRGVAERDFDWPDGLTPTVFMFAQSLPKEERVAEREGVVLRSAEDLRWARRDIKTVNLLGQALAKRKAHKEGGYEALMIDGDGFVTECSSSSFFMIKGQSVITRPLSKDILPGVTRQAVLALAEEKDLAHEERRFTLAECYEADEAFITAASLFVCPVIDIDGRPISGGTPGPLTRRLQDIYRDFRLQHAQ